MENLCKMEWIAFVGASKITKKWKLKKKNIKPLMRIYKKKLSLKLIFYFKFPLIH